MKTNIKAAADPIRDAPDYQYPAARLAISPPGVRKAFGQFEPPALTTMW